MKKIRKRVTKKTCDRINCDARLICKLYLCAGGNTGKHKENSIEPVSICSKLKKLMGKKL